MTDLLILLDDEHEQISGVMITRTGLELPPDLSFKQWQAIGKQLARAHNCFQWAIGDWWAFARLKYGERKQTVEQWGGLSFHTCENYAVVSRRFESSRRRGHLSFAHHQAVAALDPKEADELLDWCENDRENRIRTVSQIRDEVRRRRHEKMRPTVPRQAVRSRKPPTPPF